MTDTTLIQLNDAELDAVSAGGFRSINFGNVLVAFQVNSSSQTSINALSIASGNQSVMQSNNASIG